MAAGNAAARAQVTENEERGSVCLVSRERVPTPSPPYRPTTTPKSNVLPGLPHSASQARAQARWALRSSRSPPTGSPVLILASRSNASIVAAQAPRHDIVQAAGKSPPSTVAHDAAEPAATRSWPRRAPRAGAALKPPPSAAGRQDVHVSTVNPRARLTTFSPSRRSMTYRFSIDPGGAAIRVGRRSGWGGDHGGAAVGVGQRRLSSAAQSPPRPVSALAKNREGFGDRLVRSEGGGVRRGSERQRHSQREHGQRRQLGAPPQAGHVRRRGEGTRRCAPP